MQISKAFCVVRQPKLADGDELDNEVSASGAVMKAVLEYVFMEWPFC